MDLVKIDFFYSAPLQRRITKKDREGFGRIIVDRKNPESFIFFLKFEEDSFSPDYFEVFLETLESNFGKGPYTIDQMGSKEVIEELNLYYFSNVYMEPGQTIGDFSFSADLEEIGISEFSKIPLKDFILFYGGTIEKINPMGIKGISLIKISAELYKDEII